MNWRDYCTVYWLLEEWVNQCSFHVNFTLYNTNYKTNEKYRRQQTTKSDEILWNLDFTILIVIFYCIFRKIKIFLSTQSWSCETLVSPPIINEILSLMKSDLNEVYILMNISMVSGFRSILIIFENLLGFITILR